MDKNFKPVYIRGTETGTGVIKTLKVLGGINKYNRNGDNKDYIYFIDPKSHIIDFVSANSSVGKYIMAIAKEVKPLRWRAEENSPYYFITPILNVIEKYDCGDNGDEDLYDCGNYFRTEKEAKEMAEKIKKVLLPD